MRKNISTFFLAAAFVCGCVLVMRRVHAQDGSGALFPNDLGPTTIDVSGYPKPYQETYKVFRFKCSACHTIARPINSEYLEVTEPEMATLKQKMPEAFQSTALIRPGVGIWKRYVKKMMAKPGCPVGRDGKRIWEFLVYDSKFRKTGLNLDDPAKLGAWKHFRWELLQKFKAINPVRYQQLFPRCTSLLLCTGS